MTWTLIGPDGKAYSSSRPGTLGGHRGTRIFGRRAAGYRACKVCFDQRKKRSAKKVRRA